MLTIEPTGGLCNRIRTIDGAVALAADIGRPLRVIWNVESVLGASFYDVFMPTTAIHEIVVREKPASTYDWARKLRYFDPRTPPALLLNKEVEFLVQREFDFTRLATRRRPHLRTCFRLHRPFGYARLFVPAPAVQKKVEEIVRGFRSPVGVHIRRTDHIPSIAYSPTELFLERMQKAVTERPETTFFVATDDPQVEAMLLERFPGRILAHAKRSYDRSSREAIEDAAIDLFALSRTERILGSLASSYSETAAELGGIPLETMSTPVSEPLVWTKKPRPSGVKGFGRALASRLVDARLQRCVRRPGR